MCLSVPGKLVEVDTSQPMPVGKVQFGAIAREVCLAYTPEAQVGEYVLVHAGFAIAQVDEEQAREMFEYLSEVDPELTEQPERSGDDQ